MTTIIILAAAYIVGAKAIFLTCALLKRHRIIRSFDAEDAFAMAMAWPIMPLVYLFVFIAWWADKIWFYITGDKQ
jgi:hypothetical protein